MTEQDHMREIFEEYYWTHFPGTQPGTLLEDRKEQLRSSRNEHGYDGDLYASRYWQMFLCGWTEAKKHEDLIHLRRPLELES